MQWHSSRAGTAFLNFWLSRARPIPSWTRASALAAVDACKAAGIPLTLRMQDGYDHSYYFISTFMAEHVAWHAHGSAPEGESAKN